MTLDSALSYVPDTLLLLLNSLFVGKNNSRKVAAIGHAIVQAVRPRAVVAPLQVGLAVQAHHLYRSQILVDTLHQMGFGSSYKEVLRFEKNAADSVSPDMLVDDIDLLDVALLFAGDNVDHNILTINGQGTFHGMGIIAAITQAKIESALSIGKMSATLISQSIVKFLSLNIVLQNIRGKAWFKKNSHIWSVVKRKCMYSGNYRLISSNTHQGGRE